jgi:aryl-alcohol dehydrogenase-like predicted oxidoreductase
MKATIARVQGIAEKRGVSMAQVALAWSLSKDFISAPIVGTTKLEQLKDMIEGTSLELTEEEVKGIDELYEATNVQGHA